MKRMTQEFEKYTRQDLKVWKTLFERQKENLSEKACPEYLEALQKMEEVLNPDEIPRFTKMNLWFADHTDWQIEVVPGLIPVEDFFRLLSQKKFPSSTWLRSIEQMDYLEEPDMFHDIFGHVPLLSNPVFSDFMENFGKVGCSVLDDPERVLELQRLYWFTIEFGLIGSKNPKIYGAGILSSFEETIRSVEHKEVKRKHFDLQEIRNKMFFTDRVQDTYFTIADFEELFKSIKTYKSELKVS